MTISVNSKEILWCEKYRPQKVSECILPDRIKKTFNGVVKTKEIPNMILHGGAGVGKTSIAKAVCQELGIDWLIINISEESGIDTLRNKIRDFASHRSISSAGRKCVILDEFDHASQNLQAGLRGFIEAFSANCAFVMTCNYPNRIIDAIHSRCVGVDFSITEKESEGMKAHIYKRCTQILDAESIPYDKATLVQLVMRLHPDNRRIINTLDSYAKSGAIDEGILNNLGEISVEALVGFMREKKFKDIRQWCAENAKNDLTNTYTMIYKCLKDFLLPDSIPEAILILENYQRNNGIVPDKEIHICALCVEMMMNLEFK